MNTVATHGLQRQAHHRETDPGMRVGDAERERTAARLGQALSLGYLSIEDYDARVQQAMQSSTAGALDRLLTDLPMAAIGRRDPGRRARRVAAARRGVAIHIAGYAAMSLTMLGIWLAVALAVGAWYFWPIWPILGGAIGVVSHAVPVGSRTCNHRTP